MSEWGGLWGDGDPPARQYLQLLLPRGLAWSRAATANLTKLIDALGFELDRVAGRGVNLMEEADPLTANEMLADWEDVLNLPDPCDDDPPTSIADRRTSAHAKLIATGRQDPVYYLEVASTLGYTVTLSRYTPFTCTSPCNAGLYYGQWQHTVLVSGTSGDFDSTLACRLEKMRQAHGSIVLELS